MNKKKIMLKYVLHFVGIFFCLGTISAFGDSEREKAILILMDFYERLQMIQLREYPESQNEGINPELEIETFRVQNWDEKKVFPFLQELNSLIHQNEFAIQDQKSPEFVRLKSSLQNIVDHKQLDLAYKKIYERTLINPYSLRFSIRGVFLGYVGFSLYIVTSFFQSILESHSGVDLFFGKSTISGFLGFSMATILISLALEIEEFKNQVAYDLQFLESTAKRAVGQLMRKGDTKKDMKLIKSIGNGLKIPHLDEILAKVIGYRLITFPCYNEFDECTVCYDEMVGVRNMVSTTCGHKFHWNCFVQLVQVFNRCPFCCLGSLECAASEEMFRELESYLKLNTS